LAKQYSRSLAREQHVAVFVAAPAGQLHLAPQRGDAHHGLHLAARQHRQLLHRRLYEAEVGSGAQLADFVVEGLAVGTQQVQSHLLVLPQRPLVAALQVGLQKVGAEDGTHLQCLQLPPLGLGLLAGEVQVQLLALLQRHLL
jgi:hypothetical protein